MKYLGWILGIGTAVGALYILWSKKNAVDSWETALKAQKLKQQIARDEATVADMLVKGEMAMHERATVEELIRESKQQVAELMVGESLQNKTAEEIAAAFTRAGF